MCLNLIKKLNLDSFDTSKSIGGLLSVIVMPLTTIIVAWFITKKMNDSSQEKNAKLSNRMRIDESSGWRKQVLEIASTYNIDMHTVCKLRACLGPERTDKQIEGLRQELCVNGKSIPLLKN